MKVLTKIYGFSWFLTVLSFTIVESTVIPTLVCMGIIFITGLLIELFE